MHVAGTLSNPGYLVSYWKPPDLLTTCLQYIEGSRPEWGVSQAWYIVEIHHSGRKPLISSSRYRVLSMCRYSWREIMTGPLILFILAHTTLLLPQWPHCTSLILVISGSSIHNEAMTCGTKPKFHNCTFQAFHNSNLPWTHKRFCCLCEGMHAHPYPLILARRRLYKIRFWTLLSSLELKSSAISNVKCYLLNMNTGTNNKCACTHTHTHSYPCSFCLWWLKPSTNPLNHY